MNHVVIGAGIPFVLWLLIYGLRGGRAGLKSLVVLPVCMMLCALWAILPDIPLVLGDVAWYLRTHQSPWINVFFWHGTIDAMEQRVDFAPWNLLAMLLMSASLLVIAWRELNIRERHAAGIREESG